MTHALRTFAAGLTAALVLAGCPKAPTPPPPPPAAPEILEFTASPTKVDKGQTVTLTWSTRNASAVEIHDLALGLLSGVEGESGSVEVTVNESAMFVLSARNSRGVRENASAQVTVNDGADGVLFAAAPNQVAAGASAVLSWIAAGAKAVSLQTSDGTAVDLGDQVDAGWVKVTPSQSTTYHLNVDGEVHEARVQVTPVIALLQADPTSAVAGEALTLQWLTRGAQRVTVEAVGRGQVYETPTEGEAAEGTFTEMMPEVLDASQVLSYVVRAHGSNGSVSSQNVELYVAGQPAVLSFTAPEFANEGLTFELVWQTAGADEVEIYAGGQPIFRTQSAALVESGSLELSTPAQPTTYVVAAIYARGGKAMSEPRLVTPVKVPVFGDFSANPPLGIVNGGDPVTLSWDVSNATRVEIREVGRLFHHVAQGVTASTGQVVVYPNRNTTYELTADNGAGISITPVQLAYTVDAPATLTFGSSVPAGANIQLTGASVPGVTMFHHLPAVKNLPGSQFEDIVNNGGNSISYNGPDTTAMLINLSQPFSMPLFGETLSGSQINISINGWFSFRSASLGGTDGPMPMPSSSMGQWAFAPFNQDLRDVNGEIYWRIDAVNGVPRLIVQWQDVQIDLGGSPVAGSSLTFQAQLYGDGRVVYAYQNLTGVTTQKPVIGFQNKDFTVAATAPVVPVAGDTITFYGSAAPPVTLIATGEPFSVVVELSNGVIEIDGTMPLLPPNQFAISEINYNPATGESEWIEIHNRTGTALDLGGWVLDFGGGNTHEINGALPLPANGYVVLAQTAQATGGTVDYVYGSTFEMPDAAGTVSIGIAGAVYSSMAWTNPGTQGASRQAGVAQPELMLASGVTDVVCATPGGATYGASAQLGSPRGPNGKCFPYAMSAAAPNGFASIAATGTKLTNVTTHDDWDTITLPRPVKLFGVARNTLWATSEGYVAFQPISESHYSNNTTPSPGNPNGVLAPFWDDLSPPSSSAPGGLFWQQFDPDGTAASGDEYTVVSWENWQASGTPGLNFQVVIREGSGDIEYHYGAMTGSDTSRIAGSSATTWLENGSGSAALVYNVNSSTSPGIAPNTGIRFTFTP